MKVLKLNEIVSGKIETLSFGGEGLLKEKGFVLFVPFAAPEDELACRIVKLKKNYGNAEIVKIIKPSPLRVIPKCRYFGSCGGCQLQHISYEAEIKQKRQWIKDAFDRIADLKNIEVKPVIPSPKQYAYRRHISLTLNKGAIGYVSFDNQSLISVEECPIFIEKENDLLQKLQGVVHDFQMDEEKARLTILKNGKNEYLLHFHFKKVPKNAKSLIEELLRQESSIKGVILGSAKETLKFGATTANLTLDNLSFTFSSDVFMQNNPEQSLNIYHKIEEIAKKSATTEILDLYCGIGISSLLLAKQGIFVTGIESNHHSIKMAIRNAKENKLSKVKFTCAAVENVLQKMKIPDFVIINPPREGLDPRVIEALNSTLPKRIVYISCMPSTLARDLKLLKEHYIVEECQPYDMFPQTTHVETVVSLVLA